VTRVTLVLAVSVVLLASALIYSGENLGFEWVGKYQSLITGTLALVAALITVYNSRWIAERPLRHAEQRDQQERVRRTQTLCRVLSAEAIEGMNLAEVKSALIRETMQNPSLSAEGMVILRIEPSPTLLVSWSDLASLKTPIIEKILQARANHDNLDRQLDVLRKRIGTPVDLLSSVYVELAFLDIAIVYGELALTLRDEIGDDQNDAVSKHIQVRVSKMVHLKKGLRTALSEGEAVRSTGSNNIVESNPIAGR
jgi:hypothetical protein